MCVFQWALAIVLSLNILKKTLERDRHDHLISNTAAYPNEWRRNAWPDGGTRDTEQMHVKSTSEKIKRR